MRQVQATTIQPAASLAEGRRLVWTTAPDLPAPGYLDLRALAAYSSCSIRWLRDRLTDPLTPLPHYRIGGKILIRREDFDDWISRFRTIQTSTDLDTLVEDVVTGLFSGKAS